MRTHTEENENLDELIEECRQRDRETFERMDPELREYVIRKYFPQHVAVREYPNKTVAGIPPDLARILDLTEEENRQYSAG
jgi:hypothetical protein